MKILVLAEHDNQALKAATYHAIFAATAWSGPIDLFIMGQHCENVAKEAAHIEQLQTVYVADHAEYAHQLAENGAALLAQVAADYDVILAAATTFGKNILPRMAALLDVGMVSDVCKILAHDTYMRPLYAGNVLATVQSQYAKQILTIRMTAFPAVQPAKTASIPIKTIEITVRNDLSKFEAVALTPATRPDLNSARIIIAGGRGLKSAENFYLLEAIADQLGAAVGASRAAVDAGFAPNDYQVGQTGKVVAPDLYIAVGISGAIQHLAGMKDSKVVVAINSDPEAPIFKAADYGLIGDLFKILPELQAELAKLK